MLSQEDVLRLIGRIYDATADGALWPLFLEDFSDTVHGTVATILFYDWSQRDPRVGASAVRFDPYFARQYIEHYNIVNPWIKSWKAHLNRAGPESIGTSEERMDLATLRKTEFYNDYLLPQDTIHQIGCIMTKTEQAASAFACLRSQRTGQFGEAEVELLRLLFPHLVRGVQFHEKMAVLEERYRASLNVLDLLPTGVVLLDGSGRILEANRTAERILAENDGLGTEKNLLIGSTTDKTNELRSRINAAARTARGKDSSAGGSLGISRPSGRRPLGVIVIPLSRDAFPAESRHPAVIVFITDPEAKPQTHNEALAHIYGLTRAESRLAEQLIQGETLVDAAARLGVSHNTVRTHLQRIYDKTGTRHQGDLVRLVLTSAARLNREPRR